MCTCGQLIIDQSDFIKNKAYLIADQDYMDFFEEFENKEFMEITGKANKYFSEIFQCNNCNRLIILRDGEDKGYIFMPEDKEKSKNILRSYLGKDWLGILSANFTDGKGDIFWQTNIESGFRQNLSLPELKEFYKIKLDELSKLKILRHSFLRINNMIEHTFDNKK